MATPKQPSEVSTMREERSGIRKLVGPEGFEPPTKGL